MERIFVALDVETTGLETSRDEIIEIGAVKFRGDELIEEFQTFVRPRHSLPIKITRLTGIQPAALREAPAFKDVGPQLARFLKSYPVVGHSIGFDLRFLAAQGLRLNQPSYDTYELGTILVPGLPSYTLSALARRLEVPHPDAHRALADADVARLVFVRLIRQLEALPPEELDELVRLTQRVDWPLRTLFMDVARDRMFRRFEEPIAAESPAERRRRVAEPLRPTGDARPIPLQGVQRFFAADGPLGQSFPGYEPRPQQVEMATAVANAFNESQTLLIEAPTGTGKSLSYLVPSAHFARQRGERVIISTNTINLQDQLFFKDIPTLQGVLAGGREQGDDQPPPFTAALLKGRSNYLCLRRYNQLRLRPQLSSEQVRALIKVQLWLRSTTSGDRGELMLHGDEQQVWSEICATPETCTAAHCSELSGCFFFKARREAEAAHLLVVNHALLLSDIAAGGGVLPAYEHVVIDEAHNLEDVATDQLGFELDHALMLRFCDELQADGHHQYASGLLAELPHYFVGSTVTQDQLDRARRMADDARPAVERVRLGSYDLFNRLTGFLRRELESPYDPRLRITDATRNHPSWSEVERSWEALALNLKALGDGLERLRNFLESVRDEELTDYEALMLRLENQLKTAGDFQKNLDLLVFGNPAFVCWITHDQRADQLRLNAAPLHVGDALHEGLFSQKQTVVLASATLTVDGSFAYVRDRLGLQEVDELQLDSPFDYERSTLIYLPVDMPEPNAKGYQRAVEDSLVGLTKATGGRTLALFTANTPLRTTYHAIQEQLEEDEIIVLAQGLDGSRRSLLERFKEHPRTVLLGTNSFWEGVDVVGDALSVLVIAKLPFSVPNDPIFAARSELFEEPFASYAVPQAILRFKQGFGRLIRSKEDRGVVVVLDRRLLSKRYGQMFLNSLPRCTTQQGRLRELPAAASEWITKGEDRGG